MGKNNLEERLIDFAVSVIRITDKIKRTFAGIHLSEQLVRSSSSTALNYGEAQSAESRKDFIHKIKIVLKELRESKISLMIIKRTMLHPEDKVLDAAILESNELISIFVTSANTALKNMELEKSKNKKGL